MPTYGYANSPSPTPPTPPSSMSPALGTGSYGLFSNPPAYRPGQKLTASPHLLVNTMQQMSLGGGGPMSASGMPATPHIQKQLDQAALSRQSSSPHHHARMMRSTTISKDNEGLQGANGRDPSREPPNGAERSNQWTTLDLGGMSIRNISKELFRYTFLTTLYLNHNQLGVIPPQISNLKLLVRLDASGNRLTSLPPELGLLSFLKELLLFDNQLTTLPPELGFLYQLETLGLEGNPIQEPILNYLQKDGTSGVIAFLRDSCPIPATPPEREWIALEDDVNFSQGADTFIILSYNVLCEKYAPSSSYQYCPSWALDWTYRKEQIVQEITAYGADIICLQEIEMGQFEEFFQPQLRNSDYEGVFFPKSRARTMNEVERRAVDGCATFWKTSKFSLIEKHLIEFQRIPMERPEFRKSDDMFNRVTLRDNIAVITFLENKETKSRVLIANAHLHWDPSFRDVKLVQTSMLTDELQRVISVYANLPPRHPLHAYYQQNPSRLPLLVVGDFNSTPDSGVYEFMTRGSVTKDHEDFLNHSYYNSDSNVTHKLQLKSSYSHIGELNFTNYTPTFKGVIDYIWYSVPGVSVTGLLGNLDGSYMTKQVGFPNCHHPSDHIPIMAEVRLRGPQAGGAVGVGSGRAADFGNGGRQGLTGPRGFGLGGARK